MNVNLELKLYNEFVEALEIIDDEDMRFEYIIDIGKKSRNDALPRIGKLKRI